MPIVRPLRHTLLIGLLVVVVAPLWSMAAGVTIAARHDASATHGPWMALRWDMVFNAGLEG